MNRMGVEEGALISTLGNSHKDHRKLFRRASKSFFVEDEERAFEKCHDHFVKHLKIEFSRFTLLVGLVSAYRYEGKEVKESSAKSDAKILAEAVASSGEGAIENDEVVRILSTRSKLHLEHLYKHFNQIQGSDLLGGVSESSLINEALLCLLKPSVYFSKILNASLNKDADKGTKKWLTRVFVTRADHGDMKEIAEEYNQLYGEPLAQTIQEKIKGNYRDFLLTLLSKSN
ncbi:hypothetical protein HID58_052144 [Brassica napus]|uniref:Annexin n=1 Tax=Brassica napus TaxID=3708 RepID=A0ABQ8AB38_BRANA|nr:hypothetical protein HID58_052144 [Brassica napus]